MSAAAPLGTGERTVPSDWIDYNGHMMDGYYSIAFTEATDAFLDHLGLGAAYREETGASIYTVESHLCFFRSVRAGARLRYTSQLLGADVVGDVRRTSVDLPAHDLVGAGRARVVALRRPHHPLAVQAVE